MSKNIFITGTGTDVGKTYVSGLILKKLSESGTSCGYFKAAMSGNERRFDGSLIPGDALQVKEMSGISQGLDEMCPYVYENAVSPHLASRIEGNPVKLKRVKECFDKVCEKYDFVTMEGSGGILCPICFDDEKIQLCDVIKACNLSCIMVCDAGLGTINNAVLTAEYLKGRGIALKGMIFNNFEAENIMHEDNIKMCEYMTGTKVLACVKHGDTQLDISSELLKSLYEEGVEK